MATAAGAEHIATAHTADDQAETLLLRLLLGGGLDGLAGIPERSADGRVVRPLLAVSRADLERFAAARGLAWREDASNASPRYARNRLRRAPARAGLQPAPAQRARGSCRHNAGLGGLLGVAGGSTRLEEGWLRIDAKVGGCRRSPRANALARRRGPWARHLERMEFPGAPGSRSAPGRSTRTRANQGLGPRPGRRINQRC
jgi:hypothetical protein